MMGLTFYLISFFIVLIIIIIIIIYLAFKNNDPITVQNSNSVNTIIISMSDYSDFFNSLAKSLNTADSKIILSKHKALCANCKVQFTEEALLHLNLFGPNSNIPSMNVIGATQQGNDIRSGNCPFCGHTKMKIILQ